MFVGIQTQVHVLTTCALEVNIVIGKFILYVRVFQLQPVLYNNVARSCLINVNSKSIKKIWRGKSKQIRAFMNGGNLCRQVSRILTKKGYVEL